MMQNQNLVLANFQVPEPVLQIISESVRKELQNFFSSNPLFLNQSQSLDRIVDLDGLIHAQNNGEIPHIGAKSTIYKKAALGLIPHSKRGKRLYFDIRAIINWTKSNKVKTVKEIQDEVEENLQKRKRA